ncbi:MAG: proprotein convertase P-domain-containing protein [Planctomycetota bacterium]
MGPDVIVGEINNVGDYARLGDTAALSMATTACNAGNEPISWDPLPSNQHPVIAQNMYRLLDGRLVQVGQSWVKHGFAALQGTTCYDDCIPAAPALGAHCSDPYSAGQNQGPNLGPRFEINPATGFFSGTTANSHAGHSHTNISHGLQVKHADLGNSGARYFVDVQYLAADDAFVGNGNNNASYREVSVSGTSADWVFANVGGTVRQQPALFAWTGATRTILDRWPDDGRLMVTHQVTSLPGGLYRYDYAVYNMNNERGVRSFSIPIGNSDISNIGFHAVLSHDEGFSNAPWTNQIANGRITWSTESYQDNPSANAVRWGTTYNFWFETNVNGVPSSATLERFKPGSGSVFAVALVRAPVVGDCNNNGTPDDEDISGETSLDCNVNGLPDECEAQGNDCNGNNIPDDCDLSTGGTSDCNGNGILDVCDIASGQGGDCNLNTIPDECELGNDCNENQIPDDCELVANDCDGNFVPDDCQGDCDFDGIIDPCEMGLDCNANGVPDLCDSQGFPGGLVELASGVVNLSIPDGNPMGISSTLSISVGGIIADLDVEFVIDHTWVGDLVISIMHDETEVVLWRQACVSLDDIFVIVDDEGGALTCGSPTTGVIRPTSAGGDLLSTFDGAEARGNWTLHVKDVESPDSGFLTRWRLRMTTAAIGPTSFDLNANGIPDECEACLSAVDCLDVNPCTIDGCGPLLLCEHAAFPFGDVDFTGVVDVDDLLCLFNGFVAVADCARADLSPCIGDGVIDVDDVISMLAAFVGVDICCGN